MVRRARPEDAEQINALRKQVNDLHVQGRPDVFKAGFSPELQSHLDLYLNSETNYAVVEEQDGRILGMALVDYIDRPESPYNLARRFVHVTEISVDAGCRRQGVGRRLLEFIKADAREKGYPRIELDVWAFNDALAFYEAEGFTVFRRFLEMNV
ncbi:MAG: GNAT family N-acetyltransferase [Clostridia bacterium]|nr:GNAT family N-acetyltransferase [Clostridia bacterium]